MPMPKKKLRSTLLTKFEFEEVDGTNHDSVAFFYEGKKIATTRFSRNSEPDISDTILKLIARELRIDTLPFLKNMIGCTKSREDYISKLKELGYIKNND